MTVIPRDGFHQVVPVPTFRQLCTWSDEANRALAERQLIDEWTPRFVTVRPRVIPLTDATAAYLVHYLDGTVRRARA